METHRFLSGSVGFDDPFSDLSTGAGDSTNIFDFLGQSVQTYGQVESARSTAAAQQAVAPVQLLQQKTSQLFLIGALILGVVLIAKKA